MIENSIVLEVTNVSTFVYGRMEKEIYQKFKKALGYIDPNAMWKSSPNQKWDGWKTTVCYNKTYCRCSVRKDGMHFPTGLLSLAREFFANNNISVSVIDKREKVEKNLNLSISPEAEIRDYQQGAIDLSVKKGRGIIKVTTRRG